MGHGNVSCCLRSGAGARRQPWWIEPSRPARPTGVLPPQPRPAKICASTSQFSCSGQSLRSSIAVRPVELDRPVPLLHKTRLSSTNESIGFLNFRIGGFMARLASAKEPVGLEEAEPFCAQAPGDPGGRHRGVSQRRLSRHQHGRDRRPLGGVEADRLQAFRQQGGAVHRDREQHDRRGRRHRSATRWPNSTRAATSPPTFATMRIDSSRWC